MDKETFFIIVAVGGFLLVAGALLVYVWPIIQFTRRYNNRQKVTEETWRKVAMNLHDEIEIFTQQSSVRASVFEPILRPMMSRLFHEGYH